MFSSARFFKIFFGGSRISFCSVAKDVSNKAEAAILQQLSSEFKNASHIISTFDSEEIKNTDIKDWRDRIEVLKSFNVSESDCFELIKSYPAFLKIPLVNLKSTSERWHSSNLGFDSLQQLILKQPLLLHVKAKEINKRIPYLHVLCGGRKTVAAILQNCPNVMFEDWDYALSKIDYLLKEKRVPRGEIFYSKCLTKPLSFIQLRFDILEKCGVYKVINIPSHKKNKYLQRTHINPHLEKIVDSDDKAFSEAVAGITLEEYEFCSDLFNNNELMEEEYDTDDDSDDD